jgi:pSer/pThr/pTyr-binding forkhead associated (FHA) protein
MDNYAYKTCSVCYQENDPEAKICVSCGSDLSLHSEESYPTTEMLGASTGEYSTGADIKADALIPRGAIAFFPIDSAQPLAVTTENEIILGRLEKELTRDALDLSPHDALSLGVSRRHALVRRKGLGYEVIDLESTNGTGLNEKRLAPAQAYELKSGDIIWLARLPVKILFIENNPATTVTTSLNR